jgi:hypothetical protein
MSGRPRLPALPTRHIVTVFVVNGSVRGEVPRDSVFGLEHSWSLTSRAAGGSGR